MRHAAASHIAVAVSSHDDAVTVDVCDDGVGGPVVPGVGLASLSQRAASLGGQLTVTAATPHGTQLRVELPATTGART